MVLAEDIVEPQWWLLRIRHWLVPCKDGIGLAADESPVDGRYVVLLEEWEDGLEITAIASCHILGAYHRALQQTEAIDALAVNIRVAIVVIRYNIRGSQLKLVEFRAFHKPYTYCQWLADLAFACPTEDIAKQWHGCQSVSCVARLVIEIPHPYALVVLECGHDVFDVLL